MENMPVGVWGVSLQRAAGENFVGDEVLVT